MLYVSKYAKKLKEKVDGGQTHPYYYVVHSMVIALNHGKLTLNFMSLALW